MKDEKRNNIENIISALNDSVTVINNLIFAGEKTENVKKEVERNFKHIDIMLEKDFIKDSGKDLSAFTAASAAGKSFIA